MNRAWLILLGLAFVLASAPAALAQTDTGKHVSIDVTEVAPQHVFDLLAKALNCKFTVDPAVNRPLTLRVVDTPVVEILSIICRSIECEYRFDGKDYWIKPLSESRRRQTAAMEEHFRKLESRLPTGMRFENKPLSQVLDVIAKASGLALRPWKGEGNRYLSADVGGKTVNEALEAVVRQIDGEGVVMIRTWDGSWGQYRVVDKRRK
jgi:hypothetical protein